MKYFRKHPDLILIGNFMESAHRVRHGRTTTVAHLSKIIVHTISSALRSSKKILFLTDAPETKSRSAFIMKTSWNSNPFSLRQLVSRLVYNHQTNTVCLLYHGELFGFWTAIFTSALVLSLRLSGKRIVLVMMTAPKSSLYPTAKQTAVYWLSVLHRCILALFSTVVVVGEKPLASMLKHRTGKKSVVAIPMTLRSLKERRTAGKVLAEELFPSPLQDLGLVNMLKKDSLA